MKDIQAIIDKIDKLQPIPQVAQKVIAIAQDPQSSMSELSEIVTYDQILTANLLRLCNSSLFALPRAVESVHQAIVFLGLDQVVDMVLVSGGGSSFKAKQEGYGLAEGDLWRYSVSSALISREISEKKTGVDPHIIFTAALVKDIGKVVLNRYVADSYEKINFLVSKHGFSFREAEKAVIGIDHAELGGMVAEKWNFSKKMVEIIRCHHSPGEAKGSLMETSIVHMADTLCMMMGIGVGSDGLNYRFDNQAAGRLDLSERDFQQVMAGFGEKLQKVEDLVNVS